MSVLPAIQASFEIYNMIKYANFGYSHANKVKLGSPDGVLYIEHWNASVVFESEILVKWGHYVMDDDKIW